jgi:hypothetical protein
MYYQGDIRGKGTTSILVWTASNHYVPLPPPHLIPLYQGQASWIKPEVYAFAERKNYKYWNPSPSYPPLLLS